MGLQCPNAKARADVQDIDKRFQVVCYVPPAQAYLVSLFLDCPLGMRLHCPNAKARAKVEAAIRAGTITWHAFPHNAQVIPIQICSYVIASILMLAPENIKLMRVDTVGTWSVMLARPRSVTKNLVSNEPFGDLQIELMDADMVEYAIDLVHELDRDYGFEPKVTMSQVPPDSPASDLTLQRAAAPPAQPPARPLCLAFLPLDRIMCVSVCQRSLALSLTAGLAPQSQWL